VQVNVKISKQTKSWCAGTVLAPRVTLKNINKLRATIILGRPEGGGNPRPREYHVREGANSRGRSLLHMSRPDTSDLFFFGPKWRASCRFACTWRQKAHRCGLLNCKCLRLRVVLCACPDVLGHACVSEPTRPLSHSLCGHACSCARAHMKTPGRGGSQDLVPLDAGTQVYG